MKCMIARLLVVLVPLLLAGCASPPDVKDMVVAGTEVGRVDYPAALRHNIFVSNVAGGEKTNPLWTSEINAEGFKSALIESLDAAGLFKSDQAAAGYQLIAVIFNVEQPMLGFDLTVSATVDYTLLDVKTGSEVFHEQLTAQYTATMSQAFYGVERLKIANEGAARENIRLLLQRLQALTLP